MSYMALYRKWRPDEFDEVKGQEHIVTTLKNQIKHDRLGHAYLFCGTRGTGKTTIAKLMAKAVNCENPVSGSPCNSCASCRAIAAGNSMNVIEIDAASNNGVDNIRQIKEAVRYSPAQGKYLVYIIDEVHMLSKGAFNALLKTLEEPPEYVIFILATTESQSIPATISSRCQRYDFRRISVETITDRLMELLERENIKARKDAVAYIAKAADGSMRDALSILDQCIAFNLGQELTYDRVLDTVGAVDIDIYIKLMSAIVSSDVLTAVNIIDDAVWQGKDLTQVANEFTDFIRNVLVLKLNPDMTVEAATENISRLKELGKGLSEEYLINYINILQDAVVKMLRASKKRIMLEVAVIKMCKPQMQTGYAAMERRIDELEKKLDDVGSIDLSGIDLSKLNFKADMTDIMHGNSPDGAVADDKKNIENSDKNSGENGEKSSHNQRISQPEDTEKHTETSDEVTELSEKIVENFKRKYKDADYNEIMRIVSAWPDLKRNAMRMEREYLSMANVVPGESPSTIDLVFTEGKDTFMAIKYFGLKSNVEHLEQVIADFTERTVHVNVRKITPKEYQNSRIFEWDLSKINFDNIEII